MTKRILTATLSAILVLALVVGAAGSKGTIRVGTKNFTEQFVGGYLLKLLLENRGYDVDLRTGMSSMVLREAVENGDIDVCMDYTGTMWLTYAQHLFEGETQEELFEKVKAYDAERGITWLDPIWCNNTYSIAVPRAFAEANALDTLTEFAAYVEAEAGKVRIATTFEFYARPDGLIGMQLHYGFAFLPSYVIPVMAGLTAQYLAQGDVDATVVFGTDAVIAKYDWVILQDDKSFWPPYDLSPVLLTTTLDRYPDLEGILMELVSAFPENPQSAQRLMTELNGRVDNEGLEPEDVARQFLIEHGLLSGG
ncbi:MAG: glycine betaine ABC transporter substrate-binding protein [Candidatus Bipolaricaulia bacterium]